MPFHPYYTAKDGFGLAVFLLIFAWLLFFAPNYLGHPDGNYIPANPLSTPAHIVPEWYFLPFYAILKSFTIDFILPAKLWGVLAMFGSILLMFFLPWLDTSPVRSARYRPAFRIFFWVLIVDVFVLGYVGGAEPVARNVMLGQIASAYYFLHFLVIIPIVSAMERPRPLRGTRSPRRCWPSTIMTRAATAPSRPPNKGRLAMVRIIGGLIGLAFAFMALILRQQRLRRESPIPRSPRRSRSSTSIPRSWSWPRTARSAAIRRITSSSGAASKSTRRCARRAIRCGWSRSAILRASATTRRR